MRLKESRVEYLAGIVVEQLVKEGLIECEDPDAITSLVKRVITDDLMVEDHLDHEVREILRQHQNTLDRSNVEYHRMFRLIKDKLVRERNLIL